MSPDTGLVVCPLMEYIEFVHRATVTYAEQGLDSRSAVAAAQALWQGRLTLDILRSGQTPEGLALADIIEWTPRLSADGSSQRPLLRAMNNPRENRRTS